MPKTYVKAMETFSEWSQDVNVILPCQSGTQVGKGL